MYHFPYFKDSDETSVLELVKTYPFATLTGCFKNGDPVATQIPMLPIEKPDGWYIQGHIMRHTDHHRALQENPKALALFTGPNAYVSATWYNPPQIASTWNYMSVHIKGEVQFMVTEDLIDMMKRFTLYFEHMDETSLAIYDNLPASFLNKMLPAIVGIEIKIEKPDHVFKLSQNRDQESYQRIIRELKLRGGQSSLVAEEMLKRENTLFPTGSTWDPTKFDS